MDKENRCKAGIHPKLCLLGLTIALWSVACAEFSFPPQEAQIDEYGHLILPMGPYQVAGAHGEVLVGVQLPEVKNGVVEEGELLYWKEGHEDELLSAPFRPAWDRLQYVRLSNLEPGANYRMSVVTPRYETASHPLSIPPATQNKFSFLVIGDTKPYPKGTASQLVDLMNQRSASFYVHLGDFARNGDYVADWRDFLKYHRPLLSQMPILPVIGNHDRSKNLVFTNLFLLPKKSGVPTRYYEFQYGKTLFVVLDAYLDYTAGSAQYDFLQQALERGKTENFDHIFVACHKPFYSSGDHGGNKDLRKHLLSLVESYPVTAVLAAHDHSYQRTKPINGIVHIVSGGGGAKLTAASYEDYTAKTAKANHFVEFTVDGKKVSLRAFNELGQVIDEAQIK